LSACSVAVEYESATDAAPRQRARVGTLRLITMTFDRYGHLFPGKEEAASLVDAYLDRVEARPGALDAPEPSPMAAGPRS